jgi:cell division septation protein DedD
MRNEETGEYEVVVGNPQLFTAFVVVVLLCAAAFIMGYEVGRNMPNSAKDQAQANAPAQNAQPAAPQTASAPASQAANPSPQADSGSGAPPASDSAAPVEAPPQPTTHADSSGQSAQPAQTAPAAPAPPPAAQVAAMPPGSYCQAMAVRQASDARALLQTLKDGGMPASLQTGSDGLVRVMVGPYQDRADLSSAKTELENRFQIRGPICK